MKLSDVPMAMTSPQPFCPCGTALAWPTRATREVPTEPVLLTCPRCQTMVRAAYLVPMPEPPASRDLFATMAVSTRSWEAHPSHVYDIHTDACARCGVRWMPSKPEISAVCSGGPATPTSRSEALG